ncbi:MAG: helix-turn-helix domain-containing protein, partial [bacterium]
MALPRDNESTNGDGRDATAAVMAATPPKEVPALTRGLAVLRLLGRSEEPLGVNAVARQLGLVPSTCLHILRVLVAEGLVAFDPGSKRYGLDAGVLGLARGYLAQPNFAALVQPGLDELARRHGVIAIGARVLGLQHFTVVALSRSEAPIRLHIDVGRRFPALISA